MNVLHLRCDTVCGNGTFGLNCSSVCDCINGNCNPIDGHCACDTGYRGKR